MSISVIGFPTASHSGTRFTSVVDVLTSGRFAPNLDGTILVGSILVDVVVWVSAGDWT